MTEENQQTLTLKRPITVRIIVTPRWKEEVQQQMQTQINQVDTQMQTLDMQGQRAIAEIQKQGIIPQSPQVTQQIESVQNQINQEKSKLLEQKNQALQQIQQVQQLEMEQEVSQGQMESFFTLKPGDNLVNKLNIAIVIRDGIVEEIRGEV